MTTLRPLGNTVLFKFLDVTEGSKGQFSERTRGGLIIPTLQSTQKQQRWGQITGLGPLAESEGLAVGEFILIEALMWSNGIDIEDEKIWKTDPSKILCVTTDESLTVTW